MIKGMALSGRSNRLFLVMGLLLGILAAVVAAVYLNSATTEKTVSGGSGVTTVPVVVAAQDMPSGTRIAAEMLTVKSIAEDAVLVGVFDKTESIVGQVTTMPVTAGEQIIPAKITGSQTAIQEFGANAPLDLIVSEGKRAVSVEVNDIVGAGGLIRPGDFVDVILTVRTKAGPDGQSHNQISATVIQGVKVLAVAQEVTATGPDAAANPDENKDANKDATTVTLEVAPIQGEVAALADGCRLNFDGRLALALRGFGDGGTVTNRNEWPADGAPPDCASLFGLQYLP